MGVGRSGRTCGAGGLAGGGNFFDDDVDNDGDDVVDSTLRWAEK